jgi:hypothetical protein
MLTEWFVTSKIKQEIKMSMEDYKREQAKKRAKKEHIRFKQDRRGKKDRFQPKEV